MINRRSFIKTGMMGIGLTSAPALFARQNNQRNILKAPLLRTGDTIGLITPASGLFEPERTIIEAREKLQNLGFNTVVAKNAKKKRGYLGGTIEERVQDIHDMFKDDSVNALMTIRGGYGSAQILPYLDYELLRKYPKILIGYSDVTSLLTGIHNKTGLVTFHGPVAISTFTDFTKKYFLSALTDAAPAGLIDDAPFDSNLQTSNRIWAYREGQTKGQIYGGNLTLIQSLIGTPYDFDPRGKLLFFEEIGEEPYDVDRVLHHLKQAGKFEGCRGVIFDKMESTKPASLKPAFNNSLGLEEIVDDVFKDYDFPVCIGFSLGHIKNKITMPLGIKAELDAGRGRLTFLEGAVR